MGYIIEERAAQTKLYIEYDSKQQLNEMLRHLVQRQERQTVAIVDLTKHMTWLAKEAWELASARTKLSLELAQFCVDELEVMMATNEQDYKDVLDEALQVESTRCIEDVP